MDSTASEHHLIPKSKKGKETVTLHRICHDKIHSVFTESELKKSYYTIDRIMTLPEMVVFSQWVSTKPQNFTDPSTMSNRRHLRKKK